jgi:hypothetical protein
VDRLFTKSINTNKKRQAITSTKKEHSKMQAGGGGPDPAVMGAIERGNAVVFLDISLGEGENASELGRVKLELFVNDVSFEMALPSRLSVQVLELYWTYNLQ